ncbi:MAG: hypothetical protein GXX85_06800 [Ignavibacteria bacterium]|nr:hypothetical protein [Ignavibacteria bacterium]
MLKGCAIKIFFIIIIIAGVGYYVYLKFGNEIYSYAKKETLNYVFSGLEEKISRLDLKDKEFLEKNKNEFVKILKKKEIWESVKEAKNFILILENALRDKKLCSEEIENIKNMAGTNEKQQKIGS